MPSDQTHHLAAATRRRAADTRARARAALRRLDLEGSVINYVNVAEAAGVSRSLLYRDPELRKEIDHLRDRARTIAPRQPSSQRMTQASREELNAALRTEIQTLRKENHTLRIRLAAVLGEDRHAAQPHPF